MVSYVKDSLRQTQESMPSVLSTGKSGLLTLTRRPILTRLLASEQPQALDTSALHARKWMQCDMSSILFGDTMVPIIEQDYILLLGYSILYREYYLTGFNHQKNATHMDLNFLASMHSSGRTRKQHKGVRM